MKINVNISTLMAQNGALNFLQVMPEQEVQIFCNSLQDATLKYTDGNEKVAVNDMSINQIHTDITERVLQLKATSSYVFSNRVKLDMGLHEGLRIRVLNPRIMSLPEESKGLEFVLHRHEHAVFLPAIEFENTMYCLTQFELLEGNAEVCERQTVVYF